MKKQLLLLILLCFGFALLSQAQWTVLTMSNTKTLYAMDFLNNDTGMVGGSGITNPTLLKTTDGGLNWQPITVNTLYGIRSIQYPSDSVIYLATADMGDEIFKSIDGGITFNKLNNISGNSIYCTSKNTAYVTTSVSSTIWKTIDGGNNWTYFTVPGISGSGDINKLFFVTNSVGYGVHEIGGGVSSVIKTTDAGATWSVIAQPTTMGLGNVFFTSLDSGYVMGTGNLLMKTVDGGITWNVIPTTTVLIGCMFLTNFSTGWTGGDKIYYTTDSCQSFIISSYHSVSKILFPSSNIGYALSSPTVLKYTKPNGIQEFTHSSSLLIYPNPTSDFSYIILDKNIREGKIDVYNMLGENVYSELFSGKQIRIDYKLSAGIYFVQVTSESEIWSGKIVNDGKHY